MRPLLRKHTHLLTPRLWARRCYENPSAVLEAAARETRTRLLASRVWARRLSVDRRIASDLQCHLHDRPALDLPAVQFISRRIQPASLRGALSSHAVIRKHGDASNY